VIDQSVDVRVAWTRTGEIIGELPASTYGYGDTLHWASLGSASVTVPLRGRAGRVDRPLLKALAQQMSGMSIVLARGQRALWAGPCWSFNWTHDTATIGAATLGKLTDARILIAAGYLADPTNPAADLSFTLPPRDLVVQLLIEGSTGYRRDLPIVLPAISGVIGPAVTYKGADLGTVYERVKAVVDADCGPDVVLAPELYVDAAGRDMVRWNVQVGNPGLGTAPAWVPGTPAPTWDWPVSMTTLSGDRDASDMVSTGYVVGASLPGTSDRLIGVQVLDRGDPLPALERADRTSVSEYRQDQLNALAASYVAVNQYPAEDWKVEVHPDIAPTLGEGWALGDAVRFRVDDSHGWLEQGSYHRRVVGYVAGPRKLTLQTTDGAEVGMPRWSW
jgi:hypothetical protein